MKFFYVLVLLSLVAAAFARSPIKQTACRVQSQMAAKGEFKPTCDKNGDYAQIQCRDSWCWCANKVGEQQTKSQLGRPDCTGKPR